MEQAAQNPQSRTNSAQKTERDLMARLLDAFDPLELINPGVVAAVNRR
jgi:FAD/FMN-containing dehydrogenase